MRIFLGRRRVHGRRGITAVYVAIFGLLLIAFLGLSIDAARAVYSIQQLHTAADAAALAAAAQVKTDDPLASFALTRAAAVNIARQNQTANATVQINPNSANVPNGDVVVGWWDPVTSQFHDYDPLIGLHDAVKVTANRTSASGGAVSLFFGRAFGKPDVDLSRTSIAQVAPPLAVLLLVLDPSSASSMDLTGSTSLSALPGVVQVNSNASQALNWTGTPRLVARRIRVTGTHKPRTLAHNPFAPSPRNGAKPVPDPLAALVVPTPTTVLPPIVTGGNYTPGYYKYVRLSGNAVATLSPGVYTFSSFGGNKGIELRGSAALRGNNVMIFLTDQAIVDIAGGASMVLTPRSVGPYAGVSVFQNRFGVVKPNSIQGNGQIDIEGTLYLPNGSLALGGTVGRNIGRVICWSLSMNGSGSYALTGIGVPPPVGQDDVFLVQ